MCFQAKKIMEKYSLRNSLLPETKIIFHNIEQKIWCVDQLSDQPGSMYGQTEQFKD